MSARLTRARAIELLARNMVSNLTLKQRESQLVNWWCLEPEDSEYALLTPQVQQEIAESEPPAGVGAKNPKYDGLLEIAESAKFQGVLNAYLEKELRTAGLGSWSVVGEVEQLESCPCCGYRTLHHRGDYEVCRVCFWEDDSDTDAPERYSSPNKNTLGEARVNFEKLGAAAEDCVKHVDHDGQKKYGR